MAGLERYPKLPLKEKKRRRAAREQAEKNAPPNSFYHKNVDTPRVNERIEGAVNRRAAGVYVKDF
ncbi:MAG: hypothetical protein IJE68_00080 [Clostridia bacterium]|nr:hypothetical protein [Clostridia bacterium]